MFKKLAKNERGSVAIETAFVVPILATMVLGGVDVSNIVSRQAELQTAAAEAAQVVLARTPDEASERATLEGIIERSANLSDDQVSMELKYRCDTAAVLIEAPTGCAINAVVSEFIIIKMRDSYTPAWTNFGVGKPIRFQVERRVQIS